MSIHDETWDKCPKCKQVIKTWHGDYHTSGGCLDGVDFHSWEMNKGISILGPCKTLIPNNTFSNLICVDIPAPDYTGKPTTIDYEKMGMKSEDFQYKFKPMKHKNNITTGGYFLNRLRDSGFIAIRLFKDYGQHDPRKWTIMVDPSGHSLIITCYVNKEGPGDVQFEFNDGGNRFTKNYNLRTQSMEVIITTLIEKGVPQKKEDSIYSKDG
jgi:hypothetical protein